MSLRPGSAISECAGLTPGVLSTERSAKFTPVLGSMHALTGYLLIPVLRLPEGHPTPSCFGVAWQGKVSCVIVGYTAVGNFRKRTQDLYPGRIPALVEVLMVEYRSSS